jgi:hypothetical protein
LSINWRMTSLAMNSGYRFESMQWSGMRHIAKRLFKNVVTQATVIKIETNCDMLLKMAFF